MRGALEPAAIFVAAFALPVCLSARGRAPRPLLAILGLGAPAAAFYSLFTWAVMSLDGGWPFEDQARMYLAWAAWCAFATVTSWRAFAAPTNTRALVARRVTAVAFAVVVAAQAIVAVGVQRWPAARDFEETIGFEPPPSARAFDLEMRGLGHSLDASGSFEMPAAELPALQAALDRAGIPCRLAVPAACAGKGWQAGRRYWNQACELHVTPGSRAGDIAVRLTLASD